MPSLHKQLASKRHAARDLTQISQAILRQSKHRADGPPGNSRISAQERYLLDLVRRELAESLADITALENAIAAKTATPDSQVGGIEELVQRLEYREETGTNAMQKFAWPLEGEILSSPGSSVRQGGARWPGIFIQSEPGTSVRAIAAGKVVYAGEMKHLGLLVIIDHQDGYLSLYGNNGKIFVSTDDFVSDQHVIAKSQQASATLTSEFYFEIRHNGKTIDPRKVCAKNLGLHAAGNQP